MEAAFLFFPMVDGGTYEFGDGRENRSRSSKVDASTTLLPIEKAGARCEGG
jgi:hypothetical protein